MKLQAELVQVAHVLDFFFKFINSGTGHRVVKTLFQTYYLFYFLSEVKLGVSASKL